MDQQLVNELLEYAEENVAEAFSEKMKPLYIKASPLKVGDEKYHISRFDLTKPVLMEMESAIPYLVGYDKEENIIHFAAYKKEFIVLSEDDEFLSNI